METIKHKKIDSWGRCQTIANWDSVLDMVGNLLVRRIPTPGLPISRMKDREFLVEPGDSSVKENSIAIDPSPTTIRITPVLFDLYW